MRTPIEGANSVLYAAVHPDLKGVSGKYFKDCKDGYTTAAARCVYIYKPVCGRDVATCTLCAKMNLITHCERKYATILSLFIYLFNYLLLLFVCLFCLFFVVFFFFLGGGG